MSTCVCKALSLVTLARCPQVGSRLPWRSGYKVWAAAQLRKTLRIRCEAPAQPCGVTGRPCASLGLCENLASLMAQWQRTRLPIQETQIQSLERKIPWRRDWQLIPVFLPGKSHGQRSLVGYSVWGRKRVLLDLVTKAPSLSGQASDGSIQGFAYHPSRDRGLALKALDLAGVQGKSHLTRWKLLRAEGVLSATFTYLVNTYCLFHVTPPSWHVASWTQAWFLPLRSCAWREK